MLESVGAGMWAVCVSADVCLLSVGRVVGVVMRCLGEVQTEMAEQCSSGDAVTQYRRDLINPLVALTRSFVVAQCAMSEQYRQYFAVTDDVTYRTASVAVVCSGLVALAFARWLGLLGLQ